MTPRWRDRLVTRLILLVVVVGLVVGGLGAAVLALTARSALRSQVHARNSSLVNELADRFDTRVGHGLDLLRLAADAPALRSPGLPAESELRGVLRTTPRFDQLVLYGRDGGPVAAAANSFLADAGRLPPRPDLAGGAATGRARLLPGLPPTVELAVPVEDLPGSRVGTLVGIADLETLAAPLLRLDPTGPTRILVDRSGTVLLHRERDRVARRERLAVARLAAGPDGVGTRTVDGEAHLLAAAPTATLEAYAVLDQLESDALAPAADRLRDLVAILLLVAVATTVAISVVGSVVLRPVAALASTVRRIGAGERGVRAQPGGAGELAVLAGEVNDMATRRDRRDDELEALHRVTLRLSQAADRSTLGEEVTRGALELLRGDDASLFQVPQGGGPEVVSRAGHVAGGDLVHAAATVVRMGTPRLVEVDTDVVAAVPMHDGEGRLEAVLAVRRRSPRLEPSELYLLEAYAQAAAAATHAVDRLTLERQLTEELERAVQNRRDLVGTITHEFRTPLACVAGFSDVLLDDWDSLDDPTRLEMLGKVRLHAQELDALVNQLLDFSVSERGALPASTRPVALAHAIGELVRSLEPVLARRHVVLEIPDDAVAVADEVLLQRALTNLLSNAVKYSPADSTIRVRVVSGNGRVRIEVRDEGVGLSSDEAALAFQPFWRSGNPSTRGARGSGLGLSLVAGYLSAMGGSAGVMSEPGVGSNFFLVLPEPGSTTGSFGA